MDTSYTKYHVVIVILALAGLIFSPHLIGSLSVGSDMCSSQSNPPIRAVGFDPPYDSARVLERVESITGECAKATIRIQRDNSFVGTEQHRNRFIGIREAGSMALQLYSNRTSSESYTEPLGVTESSSESDEITIHLASKERIEERGLTQEAVLAHELAHAVSEVDETKSQAVPGRLPDKPTTDYVLALRGVDEGKAMWVMATYAEQYGDGEVDVTRYRETAPRSSWEQGLATVVYYYGYVHERDGHDVGADRPVISTRQLLHPEASLPPRMPERDSVLQSDSDFQHVSSDRVGELTIRYSLRTNGLSFTEAAETAAGWRNGRMDYYRTQDGEKIVHWTTHWTNETEARQFAATWRELYSDETVAGTDVIHVRATDYAPDYYYYVVRQGDRVTIVGAGDLAPVRNAAT